MKKYLTKKNIIAGVGVIAIIAIVIIIVIVFGGKKYNNESGSIKFGDYTDVTYESANASVTDEDIQAELDNLANKYASKVDSEKTNASKGDYVEISFTMKQNGELIPSEDSDGYELKLGSGTLISGFEDGIVGMKVGENKTFTLNISEEENEILNGEIEVNVTLNRIFDIVPATIDDQFAVSLGFDNLDGLMEQLIDEIEVSKQEYMDEEGAELILAEAIKNSKITVKESAVKKEYEDTIKSYEEYAKMFEQSIEEFATVSMGYKDYDAFCKGIKELARESLKEKIFVQELCKKEKITISNSEYNQYLKEIAEEFNMEVSELEKEYDKDAVEYEILRDKAIKFLQDNAKEPEKEEKSDK